MSKKEVRSKEIVALDALIEEIIVDALELKKHTVGRLNRKTNRLGVFSSHV